MLGVACAAGLEASRIGQSRFLLRGVLTGGAHDGLVATHTDAAAIVQCAALARAQCARLVARAADLRVCRPLWRNARLARLLLSAQHAAQLFLLLVLSHCAVSLVRASAQRSRARAAVSDSQLCLFPIRAFRRTASPTCVATQDALVGVVRSGRTQTPRAALRCVAVCANRCATAITACR